MKSSTSRFSRLLEPGFVVVAVILLIGAIGLNGATQYMKLYFKKQPVPLARPLDSVPLKMGHWVQVSKDQPLEHDFQEVLGTDQFIFRDYVDDRIVSADDIAAFEDKSETERRGMLAKIQMEHPEAVVNLGVTYYTGLVDTVAHIPDRCYIADGFEPTSYQFMQWPILRDVPGAASKTVNLRFISFEDQVGRTRLKKSVSYFFSVNGHYEDDPLGVRRSLQSLLQRYGYYMKIETMTLIQNQERSAAVQTDFLTSVMPEIQKCLPDWERYAR
jgi:hypothetical protein